MKKNRLLKLFVLIFCLATSVILRAGNSFYIEDFTIAPGESKEIAIHLTNDVEFSAFQADIHLPEGLSVYQEDGEYIFDLSSRKGRDHLISASDQGNNVIRLLCYSMGLKNFSGTSGELVYFTVIASDDFIGTYKLTLDGVTFTQADQTEYSFNSTETNVLGRYHLAESITLDKTEISLRASETATLTATVIPETPVNKDVLWVSTDPSVATVDENGVVTAIAVGTADITATTTDGSNLSAVCKITVEPTNAESITLDRTVISLKASETATLTATILPELTTNKSLIWTSTDPLVATVDENGVVTAIAVGTADITATTTDGSNLSATCKITVVSTLATSITLDKSEITLETTEKATLVATILPGTTTNKSLIWTSTDPLVATVDENGIVTAVGVGSSYIIATTTDGSNLSATCKITVVSTLATSITLDKTTAIMTVPETITLVATILPETTTNKVVSWASSNPSVATVNENGIVTAIALGTADITVTTTDGSNLSAKCSISVMPVKATSITLDKTSVVLAENETTTITATILPENVTNKSPNWSSSDISVATVKGGVVTAVGIGEADIIATTADGTNLSATCKVIVGSATATSIKLNKEDAILQINETITLQAVVLPETALNKAVSWSTDDSSVATVDENGVVTAVAIGSAYIKATTTDGSNLLASCIVRVVPNSISLDKTELRIEPNETAKLYISVSPEASSYKNIEWTSSDESVVSVKSMLYGTEEGGPFSYCELTGHSEGVAVITATTTDGSNLSVSCRVVVGQKIIPVTSVSLNKQEESLYEGQTKTLTATVLPENATNKTIEWTSSDETVVIVDKNGNITGINNGLATITASTTDGTNLSATCNVIVSREIIPVTSISLDKEKINLKLGERDTLVAIILPESATFRDVIWSSSDESIVSVSQGVINAHNVGDATITASTIDGSKLSASCEVTVYDDNVFISSLTLSETNIHLNVNEGKTLIPIILPENATYKTLEWISDDESIATVSDGYVYGVNEGTTVITVSTLDGSGLNTCCWVTVGEIVEEEGIKLNKTELKLEVNKSEKLSYTVTPENTQYRNLTWTSSNESVASVTNGVVTAHKEGSATIYVDAIIGSENEWTAYYLDTNWGESTVYAYVWDAGNNNCQYLGDWPGKEMTRDENDRWYIKFTADDDIITPMIIFNNGQGGGSNQTMDLSFTNNGVYIYDTFLYDENIYVQATCEVTVTESSAPIYGEEIFYESFDQCNGTGCNDGNGFSGSVASLSKTFIPDNYGWTVTDDKYYGAYKAAKFGSSSIIPIVTTPTLIGLNGDAVLTFDAAPWGSDGTTLNLSIEGGGELTMTSVEMIPNQWTSFNVEITGGTSSSKISFTPEKRFFLDEVKIVNIRTSNILTADFDEKINCIVTVEGSNIVISNATFNSIAYVYGVNGQLVMSKEITDDKTILTMPTNGLYIVRVDNMITKAVVR